MVALSSWLPFMAVTCSAVKSILSSAHSGASTASLRYILWHRGCATLLSGFALYLSTTGNGKYFGKQMNGSMSDQTGHRQWLSAYSSFV